MDNLNTLSVVIDDDLIYLSLLSADNISNNYLKWMQDDEVRQFLDQQQQNYSEADLAAYVSEMNRSDQNHLLGIFLKNSHEHVGNIKIGSIHPQYRYADIGLIIGKKEVWGQGLGTRAIRLATRYAFEQLGLNKIFAGALEVNQGSCRAFLKAGYLQVGKRKQQAQFQGRFVNGYLFECVRPNKPSRLMLGTAQFGSDYGTAFRRKQVTRDQSVAMVDYAFQQGLSFLDTAQGYGDSEKQIGEVLKATGYQHLNIFSKSMPGLNSVDDILKEFKESLARLNQNKLQGFLFHHIDDYKNQPERWRAFQILKEQGFVDHIGFSLYHPEDVFYLMQQPVAFDVVQIPFNVFDQRFSSCFDLLNRMGVTIHARSVFLQGVVFLSESELKPSIKELASYLNQLQIVSKKAKCSIASLCLNFVLSYQAIDQVLIGVDNLEQLKVNLALLDDYYNVITCHEDLCQLAVHDEKLILPYLWKDE